MARRDLSVGSRDRFLAVYADEISSLFVGVINRKSLSFLRGFVLKILTGRRTYLAGPCGPTTSVAEELNCRVRDGNGCDLLAMVTRKLFSA